MTTIDFGSKQRRAVGTQRVYLRQKWNDPWALYQNLHATEVTWCLSPSMPTATLQWDYGWVKGLYDKFPYIAQKLDVGGWYVKIVMETDVLRGEYNTWYGVIEDSEDEHGGIVTKDNTSVASGQQTLHCFGLEKLLDQEYLAESWVDTGRAAPIVVQLPITFNRGGRPNRNDRIFPLGAAYTFEGQQLTPGGTLRPTAQWWSTYNICNYLMHWATPKDSFRTRNQRIPYRITGDVLFLPVQDRPVIEQEGQTVLSLLNRLIDRRRLRAFYVTVEPNTYNPGVSPDIVWVKVIAWNKDLIDPEIPGAEELLPNNHIVSLKYDRNESTTAVLRKSRVHRYDRVVCRGARRTSTATFFYDASVESPILTAAWSSAAESAYGAGASGVAGYAGWDTPKKQQRNAEVRSADELSAVYSWFKLPDTWQQKVIAPDAATISPVFVDDGGVAVPQDIHEVWFEQQLPLYEHVDYSAGIIAAGTAADPPIFVYRNPLLVFKVPTDARYVAGDAIATLAESTANPAVNGKNFRWSATCRVHPESRVIEVRVSGEPQHVIAETAFALVKQTADRHVGTFDYQGKEMLVTATLLDNRYAEGKYPVDGAGDSTLIDEQFGYVIYAGDDYRQDYVVPDTVVDVDTAGALVKSTGGYVRDDTDTLAQLARVAYEWWNQERIILSLQTSQLTSQIQIGYLIDTIGDPTIIATVPGVGQVINEHYETVNTVVSELRISWPRLQGNQKGVPTMRFTTGAGELDPLTIAPPRTKVVSRAAAARVHT